MEERRVDSRYLRDRGSVVTIDLFVVVADSDAEQFVKVLLTRGIQRRCLREFAWVIRRDPMHDAGVLQAPLRSVPEVRTTESRVLIVLDHHGSGREDVTPEDVEEEILASLERSGVTRSRARCVVLAPELEIVFSEVWDDVAQMAARRRQKEPPPRDVVLGRARGVADRGLWSFESAMKEQPKELLLALLSYLNLRHQPSLYQDVAGAISLSRLKENVFARRFATILQEWFGARRDHVEG